MTVGVLVVIGLLLGCGWIALCWRAAHAALLVILVVLIVGSHVLALLHTAGVESGPLRAALALKDVLAWSMLLVLVLRAVVTKTRIGPALLVVAAVAVIVGFLVFGTSPAPMSPRLESIRGALVPFVSLGCAAFLTAGERARAAVGFVAVTVPAAVYALVEMTLPSSFLLNTIGVGRFWVDVKGVPLFLDPATGLPGNFFVTSGFPRLTGTFGDPLSAGTILAAALVVALVHRARLRAPTLCAVILTVALLLTFTRGGWVVAAFGVVALLVVRLGPTRAAVVGTAGAVVAGVVALVVTPIRTYLATILAGRDSSTLAHQEALSAAGRLRFTLWGQGWGTGGTVAQSSFAEAVTAESTYVALLTQIGYVGTILLGLLVVALAASGLRRSPVAPVGAAMLVALAVGGIVSENMLTFTGAFPVFVGALLLTGVPDEGPVPDPEPVPAAAREAVPA
ncbi:hypothetical protein [Actinomycetospora sp. NBRC 106378]|uniref:hypothetical protein n=1 Tax=Actinomycetospora sp. NBRC 106378 TaxID=3032208 RepID=UPI0024A43215|nr:hypothetical protein [Actinomycetospora sp. NBRC 106378]GLZ51674.1 hypothetical protein Acsp07_12910 [Actinomycetospora sp. NBRC 106378]